MIVRRKNAAQKPGDGPQKSGKEAPKTVDSDPQTKRREKQPTTTQQRCRQILETMISDPYKTKEALSTEIGVSRTTLRRYIALLRGSYVIEWEGSSKTGHWKIEAK